MFKFTVEGLPPQAKYWYAWFDMAGDAFVPAQRYFSEVLRQEGEVWTVPAPESAVDVLHINLYDSSATYLGHNYARSLYYGITVVDDGEYEYNWATGIWRPVDFGGEFKIDYVSIEPQYVNFDQPFLVTFFFDYSGPDIIGGVGLKVALGTDGIFGFNEVHPIWIQSTSVYERMSTYTKGVSCLIPIQGDPDSQISEKVYDITCEIGTYPWKEGTVYDKWRMRDVVSVTSTGEPPPDGNGVVPLPDGIPPTEGKWPIYVAIGLGVVMLGAIALTEKPPKAKRMT